jgi:hypothetical protein
MEMPIHHYLMTNFCINIFFVNSDNNARINIIEKERSQPMGGCYFIFYFEIEDLLQK